EHPCAAARTIDVGGRSVELSFVGPAHTVGDAIAWVPDTRAVFGGDILVNDVTTVMWAGPVGNWIVALERIEALEPAAVVGGHGPGGGAGQGRGARAQPAWVGAAGS